MTVTPQAVGPWLVELWRRTASEPPVVVLRCGIVKGCGKVLGRVWATREGLLLQHYQHVAGRYFKVYDSEVDPDDLAEHIAAGRSLLPPTYRSNTGPVKIGLQEDGGWLAMVDVDDWWHPAIVGCWVLHTGVVELDRQELLDTAMHAVTSGRRKNFVVSAR